jgi:hypothetical protein
LTVTHARGPRDPSNRIVVVSWKGLGDTETETMPAEWPSTDDVGP